MLAPIVMFIIFLKGNKIRTLIPGISALPQSACAHLSNLLQWSWASLPTCDQKCLVFCYRHFCPLSACGEIGSPGEGDLWIHVFFQVLFLFGVWGPADGVGWEVLGCVSSTETLALPQASCDLILPGVGATHPSQPFPSVCLDMKLSEVNSSVGILV